MVYHCVITKSCACISGYIDNQLSGKKQNNTKSRMENWKCEYQKWLNPSKEGRTKNRTPLRLAAFETASLQVPSPSKVWIKLLWKLVSQGVSCRKLIPLCTFFLWPQLICFAEPENFFWCVNILEIKLQRRKNIMVPTSHYFAQIYSLQCKCKISVSLLIVLHYKCLHNCLAMVDQSVHFHLRQDINDFVSNHIWKI